MEDALAPFLLGLDRLPALADPPRRTRVDVSEDVRMASHELRVHVASDGLEVPLTTLLEQKRQEIDLEEEVAELSVQRFPVVDERGIRDLVGLLDGVRNDRRVPSARDPRDTPGAAAG